MPLPFHHLSSFKRRRPIPSKHPGMKGAKAFWFIFLLMQALSFSAEGSDTFNPDSLHSFLHHYASNSLAKHRRGALSLPANFSGMDVSVVRIRSGTFWARGTNFSSINIPPRIIPMPFVKILDIVYENLGNWSSHYYKVPSFSLITPVIGFAAYNSSNSGPTHNKKLELSFMGDPISVRFPPSPALDNKNVTMKCVKFGNHGSIKFFNMTTPNTCYAKGQGHFAVVIPSPVPEKKERVWKWWVIGLGGGFVGFGLMSLVGMMVFKVVRKRKIAEMERGAEQGVTLDTIWIGRSKMPSATVIRTQPALENGDFL